MENNEITLKISGMMCDGCESTVVKALKSVEGVVNASASHQEGTASVNYDADKTDPIFITMAVNNTNYKVVES